MAVSTWPVTKDISVIDLGGTDVGAGQDNHLMVGRWSGSNLARALLYGAAKWTVDGSTKRFTRITKGELWVRYNDPPLHASRGSNPKAKVQRLTDNIGDEGTGKSSAEGGSGWNSSGEDWGSQPGATASNQSAVKDLPTSGSDSWVVYVITDIIGDVAPADIEVPVVGSNPVTYQAGRANAWHGVRIIADDESLSSRYHEYLSREAGSSYDAYFLITGEDNTAPTAPINLTPTGDAIVVATNTDSAGGLVTFTGTSVDADAGDYIGGTGVDLQVYEDDGATLVSSVTFLPGGSQPETFSKSHRVPTGRWLKWRARTYDSANKQGAWSAMQRFWANTVPGEVLSPTVDTDTLTPTFRGTIDDPDPGATMSAFWVRVEDVSTGERLWDSGWMTQVAGTVRAAESYGGAALSWGVGYRYSMAAKDEQGAEGPFFATWLPFTPQQVLGPSNMTPRDTNTKQNTLTPTLTIGHSANFDYHEVEVADNPEGTGTLLWDVGPTSNTSTASLAKVYAGASLAWGRVYYWRAKVRNASTLSWTEWSQWYPFYVNSLPRAAVLSVPGEV